MADNKTSILITAEDRASAALRSVQTNLTGLSSVATRILPQLTALTGAFSLGGIASFAKQTIDAADALNDMSDRTGLTVRNLAEWQLAIKLGDATMEDMATGLRNLSIYLVENGDKLQAAGITAKDARGAFMQLADLFKAMPEGPERAALANEIFKRSGQALLPVLLRGSEALEDSARRSKALADAMTELAPKAAEFNDTLDLIGVNLKSAGISAMNPYMDGLLKMAKTFNEATESATGFKNLLEELQKVTGSGPLSIFGAASKGVDLAYLMGYGGDEKGRSASGRIGGSTMLPGANSPAEIAANERAKKILDNTAKVGAGKTAKKGNVFDPEGDFFAAIDEKQFEAQKKAADDSAASVDKYNEALKNSAESLYAATDAGKFDGMIAQLKLAEEIFNSPLNADGMLMSQEQFDAVTSSLMGVNDELAKSKDIGKELGMTFSSAFEDAIVSGKKFSDVLQGLAQDILRLVVRKTLTEPMADAISSFDFGSLFKANATGGVYASPGLSAYSGSVVSRPTVFPFASGIGLMGEAGPEAILPLKRGSNGKLGVEGGGSNVVVNVIESPGNGGKQEQRNEGGVNILDIFVERVKSSIAGDISDGRGGIPAALTSTYGLNRSAGAY